jgi:virginiamycin B lyase
VKASKVLSLVLLLTFAAGMVTPIASAETPEIFTVFPTTDGQPFRICAESPQVIWYTLPDQNALGRLSLVQESASIENFVLPTTSSQPYDIACAGGRVWVTERAGNKIAMFDPAKTAWSEYDIPTPASEPTGIEVQPGEPTQVWFVERTGNKIGRLTVPAVGQATLTEYESPIAGMLFEDISLAGPGTVWFTAPGAQRIGRLNANLWPSDTAYAFEFTGPNSQPWKLVVDPSGYPWFTERTGNRIGQFQPGTLTNLRWVALPNAGSDPYAIDIWNGGAWFTEAGGQRVGRVDRTTYSLRELVAQGAMFTGIDFSNNGCAWLSDNALQRIVRWCPPYFRMIYLPLIRLNS